MAALLDRCEGGFAWREASPPGLDHPSIEHIPLLLLHGLGGSRLSWEPQLAALGEQRRVLAWELPGYGDSHPLDGPLTFAGLADAACRFLDVVGADRAHVAGISFGGMIAQYVAALHPDRLASLTLLSTSPKFGLDGTRPDEWRAARLAPLDAGLEPADFADRVLSALAGPHITDEALAGQRAAMGRVTGAALRRSIDCLVTHDSFALLRRIEAPTRCLVGSLDDETPISYARAIVEGIAGAELTVIDGAGHLLNVEAVDEVNEAIRQQCDTHDRPGGPS